jgi:hypothetical protein
MLSDDRSCKGIKFTDPSVACDKHRISSLRTVENPVFEVGDEHDSCDNDDDFAGRILDRSSHEYDTRLLLTGKRSPNTCCCNECYLGDDALPVTPTVFLAVREINFETPNS